MGELFTPEIDILMRHMSSNEILALWWPPDFHLTRLEVK